MSLAQVPPPDFRYVALEPVPPAQRTFGWKWALLALAGVGGLAHAGGADAGFMAAGVLGVGALALTLKQRETPALAVAPAIDHPAIDHMAIVPWGVLLHSAVEPRVLRWESIKAVEVRYVHEMSGAVPRVRWSVVTLDTEQSRIVGRHPGVVNLERLEAHLNVYSELANRPVALDASGRSSHATDLEPVIPRLVDYVRRALHTPSSVPELELSASGYRSSFSVDLSHRGQAVLRRWLVDPAAPGCADKRPLAALFAAELGAMTLVEDLLRLVTAPHPFVAATARAAALRLKADLRRVGALEELAEFLPAWELEALEVWTERATSRVVPQVNT